MGFFKQIFIFILIWAVITALSFFCFFCLFAISEGTDDGVIRNIGLYLSYVILFPHSTIHLLTGISITHWSLLGGLALNALLVTIIPYVIWLLFINRKKNTAKK